MGPLGLGLALAIAGCANTSGTSKARSLAASFAAGRAYDRAQGAIKSGDDARFGAAGRDFNRAQNQISGAKGLSRVLVPQLVSAAMQLDNTAAQLASLDDAPRLRARALQKYRAANALLPAHPAPATVDAVTLNAIGYALADRGTSRADWTRGAQLTRLSLDEWDRQAKGLSKNDPRRAQIEAARMQTLDSNAWALFRLGRFKQARRQQERVMSFARKNPKFPTAELPFHLAEIYRALGRDDDAKLQYQAAQDLAPDAQLALQIDAALNAKIV